MDAGSLDRWITGNYGEDQYEDCPCGDEECEGEHEDDRDFDSMPGGWDYEEPDYPEDDIPIWED